MNLNTSQTICSLKQTKQRRGPAANQVFQLADPFWSNSSKLIVSMSTQISIINLHSLRLAKTRQISMPLMSRFKSKIALITIALF